MRYKYSYFFLFEHISTPFSILGSVGKPFPSVKIRIIADDGKTVLCEGNHESITEHQHGVGTLEIKGDSVFKGYLNRKDATEGSFTNDGWFITGFFFWIFSFSKYF